MIDPFLENVKAALLNQEWFDPKQVTRTVRFGIVDDLDGVLLPKLITTLQEQAPGVRLTVRDIDYQLIDQLLQSGDTDVVVAAILPAIQQKEHHRLLYTDHFVALFDQAQLRLEPVLDMETYLGTAQILVSLRGDTTGMIDAPLQEMGLARDVMTTLTKFSTLPLVLKQTKALCNVPTTIARFLADYYGLETRDLPLKSPEFTIGVAWRRELNADPFTRWFVDLVAQLMTEQREAVKRVGA
ncbi:LysR substrate-binding domain-containing protein [Pseudomonas syringae]|uniref:LysR substrate-binding domain-containing protein n=1 Tax=Pseudomonas syringae TaxID=317 RepID=UPI000BB60085|nr:LysR substrate-binding domain-containing protein [Pseudomonas syringae]PBP46182.1 hypothetical protein CCL13_12345 [Pseudomonas syringae]